MNFLIFVENYWWAWVLVLVISIIGTFLADYHQKHKKKNFIGITSLGCMGCFYLAFQISTVISFVLTAYSIIMQIIQGIHG